ncbi:ubiquitin-protein ligase E3A, partial [Dothidotthia symphoricarpi CBS 119687]
MSASDGRPQLARPPDAPRRRLSNVIDVQDALRVVECSQVERQLKFQHLVRHYLSQILHGCKSAYCDTSTCFSCNKRNASKPFRPPTQLTARALAHYLASQDNPHRGLCPHELKVAPSTFEIDGAAGAAVRHGRNGAEPQYSVYPAVWTLVQQQRHAGAITQRHQSRKDKNALGQHLYDSVTMIYSYSKQLPSPTSVLTTLRSLDNARSGDQTENDESSLYTNAQHVTPHVNDSAPTVRRQSQQDSQTSSPPHPEQSAAELLKNGQQVLRIPYHLPSTTSQCQASKPVTSTSLDGTFESPKLSKSKTGKEPSPLDRQSGPAMGRPKPSPAAQRVVDNPKPADRKDPVLPIVSHLNCDVLDQLKDEVYHHRKDQSTDFNFVIDYDMNARFRPTKPYVNRSLFYTLSDTDTLLKSFHDSNEAFKDSPLSHLDSARLTHSFRDWNRRNGALIFDSLWIVVEALFTPPPELDVQKSPRLRPSRKRASVDSSSGHSSNQQKTTAGEARYLDNNEAAHIVMICIHALTSLIPVGWSHTWAQLRKLRSWGVIIPNAAPNTHDFSNPYLNIIDELEYEPAIRLADRLLRGIGARTCFEHILESLQKQGRYQDDAGGSFVDVVIQHLEVVERVALASKRRMKSSHDPDEDPGWTVTATFMEWLKTIIVKKWDNKAEINKWNSVGTAVMLLDKFHLNRDRLNVHSNMFHMPFFNERIDVAVEPLMFLNWESQPNTLHIFQYPCLFPTEYLVAYFRTINFASMMTQYDSTTRAHQLQSQLHAYLREPHRWLAQSLLKVTLNDYLVLDVSREQPLKDTLDLLWGQNRKTMLKPLKVKIGREEGEIGLDHGGVTYEFFRVVLSEAFKPEHGMFTIDPQSRMTWFQPGTLEPIWKFEMLGVLFSLAVYNGITLPVTFPLALYYHLLDTGESSRDRETDTKSLNFIQDGWPGLAKAFEQLLSWTDGDVGDVMMRDYTFSYEAFGQKIDINMQAPPSSNTTPEEPILVTNANRTTFVTDYIHHLTHVSVEKQLHAFHRGFKTCINPTSLSFFTPTTLRHLIEGSQTISIPALRAVTKYYEGYSASHPTIKSFWSVVEDLDQDDCRRLLEFVTASDRVPVTGYEGVTFHIVRGGPDTLGLPTSSTCFGKLYLPEYGDEGRMREKVRLAIGNSRGFGV